MASIGQHVEIRGLGFRWLPAAIIDVGADGALTIRDAGGQDYWVHRSVIRRDVRLHPKKARAARLRAQARLDLGLVRTPYGWE